MPDHATGPDDWRFLPEGAGWHPSGGVAVIADLHLGYEWARAADGDMVLPHTLRETLNRLERLLARIAKLRDGTNHPTITELIVAGDVLESPAPCAFTRRDFNALTAWLRSRRIELTPIRGNHDPQHPQGPDQETWPLSRTLSHHWTVAHGHRALSPNANENHIIGHHHPSVTAEGVHAPCFLVSETLIILPAFSPNAAGLNLLTAPRPADWTRYAFRCLACAPDEILDLGPLNRFPQPNRQSATRPRKK